MAYVSCMPARVIELAYGMDNIVTGRIETETGEKTFTTRGHIIKAVNKHYRRSDWKPRRGERIMVDGDVKGDSVIIDHLEPDPVTADVTTCHHAHLDAISEIVAKKAPNAHMRVWRGQDELRIRFATPASRKDRRGDISEEIVHAVRNDAGWKLCSRHRNGAGPAATGVDAQIAVILARAAGREMLVGETAMETDSREQAEMRSNSANHSVMQGNDDCPF